MKSFGQRLKSLRHEAGFSQSDLSDRIGVSVQSISKWENDNTMPDISQIVPLAAVLGVSTDWLLGVGMNEDEDLETLKNRIRQIQSSKSSTAYFDNADRIIYDIERDFLKKYPLNHEITLDSAKHLHTFLFNSTQKYYQIPDTEFSSLISAGIKSLEALINQDKDPSRQIEARLILIEYMKFTKNWAVAEQIAMELPESYEIRYEALLGIAGEMRDFKRAEELSKRVSKMRAGEYVKSLHDRARRISIYGDVRKEEAIAAWKDMENAARDMVRIFGNEMPELLDIVRYYLLDALACESGDYLAISDVNSALDCVEKATLVAIDAFETAKKSGYKDEKLTKFAKDCAWVPIMCYSKVIANPDNILTREPRYKACVARLEALA